MSERNSFLHLSLPLKVAQVPWGHKGDGFKLIITSIHYRGSWIYSWVHFLITWFCIENYSLMFSTCNRLHKPLITLSLSISNDWFPLWYTPCCWFSVTFKHNVVHQSRNLFCDTDAINELTGGKLTTSKISMMTCHLTHFRKVFSTSRDFLFVCLFFLWVSNQILLCVTHIYLISIVSMFSFFSGSVKIGSMLTVKYTKKQLFSIKMVCSVSLKLN